MCASVRLFPMRPKSDFALGRRTILSDRCLSLHGGLFFDATKTLVDNVCRQVVERYLISGLPAAFGSVFVGNLSNEELSKTASESACVHNCQNDLQAMSKALEKTSISSETGDILLSQV
jgi:hypothetical protein